MSWKSFAQWPEGHFFFSTGDKNTTEDTHATKEQAEAVCEILRREGLGGERIHFPVKTWVEEVKP